MIHVNNQITITKAGRLSEEVFRLEPVPRWPVQPVAQNILLCDDSIIGKNQTTFQRQDRQADTGGR